MTKLLLLFALLVLGACAHPAPHAAQPPTIPNPNGPFELATGERLTITLDANPTTGFEWQLATSLDAEVLTLVRHEFHAPESTHLGAGGTDVWTFKGVGPGSTTIVLEYRRPWEKDVPPAERKTFTVVVR